MEIGLLGTSHNHSIYVTHLIGAVRFQPNENFFSILFCGLPKGRAAQFELFLIGDFIAKKEYVASFAEFLKDAIEHTEVKVDYLGFHGAYKAVRVYRSSTVQYVRHL